MTDVYGKNINKRQQNVMQKTAFHVPKGRLSQPDTTSSPGLNAATRRTLVAAVVVNGYLYARFRQRNALRQTELHVTDVHAALYPLAFVVCPD